MDKIIQIAVAMLLLSVFLRSIGDTETPQIGPTKIIGIDRVEQTNPQ